MNGGPSQVDMFDPKPLLKKYHGKPIPREIIPEARDAQASGSPAFASPWKFEKRGQSGIEISELLPHLGGVVDDLCIVRSMYADDISHDGGIMFMNTGAARLSRPSLGSWVTYGLGSENRNLPGFIALCPDGYPLNETQNWQSAFLPGVFQGTFINSKHEEIDKLIENIRNGRIPTAAQRTQLDLLGRLNRIHQAPRADEGRLESRIQSFEQAFRMQMEATDAFDLAREPKSVIDLYGPGVQRGQPSSARRLLERGVRMVQCWYGPGFPWDHHGELDERMPRLRRRGSPDRRVYQGSQATRSAGRHADSLGRRIRSARRRLSCPSDDPARARSQPPRLHRLARRRRRQGRPRPRCDRRRRFRRGQGQGPRA